MKREYYSSLNYQKATHLLEDRRKVEFSDNGTNWTNPRKIMEILNDDSAHRFIDAETGAAWIYIRTCPETYAPKKIIITDSKLPLPEITEPVDGKKYFTFMAQQENIGHFYWAGTTTDRRWLSQGRIHLTEKNAQSWANWWKKNIVDKLTELKDDHSGMNNF